MSTGLPRFFDPERLAAHGTALTGMLDTDSMLRLRGMLASGEPIPVRVELQARRDEARRLVLAGQAAAKLPLICQRCMEAMMQDVDARFALAAVPDEDAARNLPAELDPLLMGSGTEVDLHALVEDELILALPPVPMHANAKDCGEAARYAGDADAFDGTAKRENPFAVLKKLKERKY